MSASPKHAAGFLHTPQNDPEVAEMVRVGKALLANGTDPAPLKPLALRHIADIVAEQREPEWLIDDVIEKNVVAVMAGKRSTFKSFIALDWAMRMAIDGHAGVILSGEGAGLDRRVAAWLNHHRDSLDVAGIPLVALERPLRLTAILEMEALRTAVGALPKPPEFVVIDTLSKFSAGLDENSNTDMAEFISLLGEQLRDDLKVTVLLVAHAGHGDAKRPRGAYALMANPDAEYWVDRPDPAGMTVTVSRERFKDTPALRPLAYEATVVDLGRCDKRGKPVTSLALMTTDVPQVSALGRGRNQEKFDIALREFKRANPDAKHISTPEMTELCKAQGIPPKRRREVYDSLVNARVLSPAVGGYTFHGENL